MGRFSIVWALVAAHACSAVFFTLLRYPIFNHKNYEGVSETQSWHSRLSLAFYQSAMVSTWGGTQATPITPVARTIEAMQYFITICLATGVILYAAKCDQCASS